MGNCGCKERNILSDYQGNTPRQQNKSNNMPNLSDDVKDKVNILKKENKVQVNNQEDQNEQNQINQKQLSQIGCNQIKNAEYDTNQVKESKIGLVFQEEVKNETNENPVEQTIYAQIGKDEKVKQLIDIVFDYILNDKDLVVYYQDRNIELVKEKYFEYLKYILQGRKFYIGQNIDKIHQKLYISDKQFDQVYHYFVEAMRSMRVKRECLVNVLKILQQQREHIVYNSKQQQNLYEKLGGINTIQQFIDKLYDQIQNDESLMNFHKKTNFLLQKKNFTLFLVQIITNQIEYSMDYIQRKHQGMGIKKEDYQKFNGYLAQSMSEVGIEAQYIQQTIDIINSYSQYICEEEEIQAIFQWRNQVEPRFNTYISQFIQDMIKDQEISDCFLLLLIESSKNMRIVNQEEEKKALKLEHHNLESQNQVKDFCAKLCQDFFNYFQKINNQQTIEEEQNKIIEHLKYLQLTEYQLKHCIIIFQQTCKTLQLKPLTINVLIQQFKQLIQKAIEIKLQNEKEEFEKLRQEEIKQKQIQEQEQIRQKLLKEQKELEEQKIREQKELEEKQQKEEELRQKQLEEEMKQKQIQEEEIKQKQIEQENQQELIKQEKEKTKQQNQQEQQIQQEQMQQKMQFQQRLQNQLNYKYYLDDLISYQLDSQQINQLNKIIFQEQLDRYIIKQKQQIQRWGVLNQQALLIYKDQLFSKSFPQKPLQIIPLQEIQSIQQKELILNINFKKTQTLYYVEIQLKIKYEDLVQSIAMFSNFSNYGQQGKAKQTNAKPSINNQEQQNNGNQIDQDDNVICFYLSDKKNILKWKKYLESALSNLQEFFDQNKQENVKEELIQQKQQTDL